jgi:hypothetical protein
MVIGNDAAVIKTSDAQEHLIRISHIRGTMRSRRIDHNAGVEAINTEIRLINHRAFGVPCPTR